jgi:putative ABC transport system permease protein
MSARSALFDRVYRALLGACPPHFAPPVDEMLQAAEQSITLASVHAGAPGRALARLRALADLTQFVVIARRDSRGPFRRPTMHLREVRQTLRLVRQQPAFSAAVVLMLALGIGATTAIFTVVHGVLLRPLALHEPDRIVDVYSALPSRSIDRMSFAEANTWDIRDLNNVFSAVAISHSAAYSLTGGGTPDRVGGSLVSAGYFDALGIVPIVGRVFQPGEDEPGAPAERVVLTEPLWARRYARSRDIVGQMITLDGKPYEVIGVVPVEPAIQTGDDVYVPFIRRGKQDRGSWEYEIAGRLKPGVTLEQAAADLKRVTGLLRAHKENEGMEVLAGPSSNWVASPDLRRALWLMLGAVGLLLVIASVNVANLLLVRAASRTRERALRTALGAERRDLIREGLMESVVLAVIGGAAGVLVAIGLIAGFKAWDPGGIPRLTTVRMDFTVWALTAAVTLAVGIVTGLVPALRSPMTQIVAALRDGQRGLTGDRRHDRTRTVFVAVEVALSVLLLVGAGLLTRSLINVLTVDRGFATEHRLSAEITMPGAYPDQTREQIAERILARVEAMPEVASVGSVSGRMLVGGGTGMGFAGADRPIETAAIPWATWRIVTKDYFRAIGLTLKRGRGFTEQDVIAKPWRVVIGESLARRIWGGDDPIGKTARLWTGQGERKGEVIGVVSDMREHRLDDGPTLSVYLPAYGGPLDSTTLALVIETKGDPEAVKPALLAAVREIDPLLPVSRMRSIEDLVSRSVATRRFTMLLIAAFATLAFVLALAGVAGVLLYTMARRTAEMGLRLALGAEPRALMRRALMQGLRPVAIGLVAGVGIAFWLSRLTTSLLYGVTPMDPLTYVAVAGGLLAAATLACYGPARRALRIDPAVALRE